MRVFVTGGAGFIGRCVVARLRQRGDDVVLAVRDPAGHADADGPNVRLVQSDLSEEAALAAQMSGCDALIHGAGRYRIGIRAAERRSMWEANVGATRRVLDAAISVGIARIVHVSTVNAFGNTRGQVADETWHRDPARGFVSYYDETKWRAHLTAEDRIARGAPVIIVMPGTVIGPGDHSGIGQQLKDAHDGTLRYRGVDDVGISPVHVDDVAKGILAALDEGRVGRSYVVAGRPVRLAEAMELAARLGGHALPRLRVPTMLLRAAAPLAGRLPAAMTRRLGMPENLAEVLSATTGVTYWASSARAERELGFGARDLETSLRDTFAAG